tara:strand:- start:1134 stop:1985 length:852 start_codon:yes stop_codon:yes gene_type:complete
LKTVLITGINGFLGSNIAKLFSKNFNVIGLEYSKNNFNRIKDFKFKVYSVENGVPKELFTENKIDLIIHTATLYDREIEKDINIINANLFLPITILDLAIKNNCELFINTDTVLDRFTNIYSLTKHQFKDWLIFRKKNIKVINMKLEHFYGPDSSSSNFIKKMITNLKNNVKEINLTYGEQERNFIFIDDVSSSFLTVVNNIKKIKSDFMEFQVGTNELIKIKDLMLFLKENTNSNSVLNFGAIHYRDNELMKSEINNSDILELGWRPKVKIEKGLKLCIENR